MMIKVLLLLSSALVLFTPEAEGGCGCHTECSLQCSFSGCGYVCGLRCRCSWGK
uniref:Toxin CjTL7 n=1 Tax=Epiactis japonica TaxID=58804 RepID=CJTL7_EPIJA|nr:RecName: Full=Toxin CjTL7; Flags: Precursor [Epiactis japonica]